jgi:hypothetical protein
MLQGMGVFRRYIMEDWRRNVKRACSLMVVIIAVLGFSGQVLAGKKQGASKGPDKPEPLAAELIIATATVEAIDFQKRTVKLRGADGRTLTIKVDKGVTNFDQIKTGDQVKAEVLEEVGVYVRKPDWPPAPLEVGNVAVAPRGRSPAVIFVDIIQLPGTVEAVDHAKHTVTLRGPEGNIKTFAVDRNVKRFEKLRKGEEIVLVITEAVAISVRKP